MRAEKSRPASELGGSQKQVDDLTPMLPEAPHGRLSGELDDVAHALSGAFVVVVEVTGEPVKYRRRPYLSAAAAERAASRALERGQNARVYLAELTPLYRLIAEGGDQA